MIVTKEFLTKLKAFGLNSYEAKLWIALLSRGTSTAGELSDIADVPRSRTYDVLESLEQKGFIQMKLGKPIGYVAVAPDKVIDNVKSKAVKNAEKKVGELSKLNSGEVLKELSNLHMQGSSLVEPSDLSAVLKGRENLYHHLNLMIAKAKKNIKIVTTEQGLARKAKALLPLLQEKAKKGVKVELVGTFSKKAASDFNFAKVISSEIDSRFVVVDNKEVVLMLEDDKVHPAYDAGIWVCSPFFAATMSNLFKKAM